MEAKRQESSDSGCPLSAAIAAELGNPLSSKISGPDDGKDKEPGPPSEYSTEADRPPKNPQPAEAVKKSEEKEAGELPKTISPTLSQRTLDALHSAKTWEELQLPEDLLRGVHVKGFSNPSKIQELALPKVLGSNRHLVAQAQNGSGKTAAFSLCMLAKVQRSLKATQSLCVCHTRELAQQSMAVIRELGRFTGISTWLAVAQGEQYDGKGAQIVVGTPGKLKEMLQKRILQTEKISLFVLDEADLMMDYAANMASQVSEIRQRLPRDLQILLFSATFPDRVQRFVETHVPNAARIEIRKEDLTLETVDQYYMECSDDNDKLRVLSDLYGCLVIGQSIIFANTRQAAFKVAEFMKREGHAVSLICGTRTEPGQQTMNHIEREKVMNEFRYGETKVLIATDVLARGIDVPQVTLVINYDCPVVYQNRDLVDHETYIHRIGRTGRFGLRGLAISFIAPYEQRFISQVTDYYRCSLNPLSRDPEEVEKMLSHLR